jgi:cytochrome d ubiquinol oxidase subunit I
VFVAGVSSWLLLKKRQEALARDSMKVASVVGLAGIVLTMWTGDGSAVEVSRSQPMKLAAMEGLYRGSAGQDLVGVGILNPSKRVGDDADPMLMSIDIPYGLSVLAKHDAKAFVPGIDDLIEGVELTADGDTVITESYADKIARGKRAHEALRCFDSAMARGDSAAMAQARTAVEADFPCFGYGYFDDPAEIVPPVALTFYAFRVMVSLGGLLVLYLLAVVYGAWRKPALLSRRWMAIAGVAMVALVWICSESGWIVAEVGRQPWVIQDLMPTRAAISAVPVSTVMTTFWMFALVFTLMLVAEVSIMTRYIARRSKEADKI